MNTAAVSAAKEIFMAGQFDFAPGSSVLRISSTTVDIAPHGTTATRAVPAGSVVVGHHYPSRELADELHSTNVAHHPIGAVNGGHEVEQAIREATALVRCF